MTDEPLRKLWLVFFSNSHKPAWWHRFLHQGFRHVSAAAFYPAANRWVYFDPTARGTVIEVWHPDDFWQRFGQLIRDSTVILRMPSGYERRWAPFSWWCVGGISSILGHRLSAFSPFSLHRKLLALGAEIVEREHDQPFQAAESTDTGPEPIKGSEAGGEACGEGPYKGATGSALGRDAASQ